MLTQRDHVPTRHHTTTSQGEETSHQETIERVHVIYEGKTPGSDQGMYSERKCCHQPDPWKDGEGSGCNITMGMS